MPAAGGAHCLADCRDRATYRSSQAGCRQGRQILTLGERVLAFRLDMCVRNDGMCRFRCVPQGRIALASDVCDCALVDCCTRPVGVISLFSEVKGSVCMCPGAPPPRKHMPHSDMDLVVEPPLPPRGAAAAASAASAAGLVSNAIATAACRSAQATPAAPQHVVEDVDRSCSFKIAVLARSKVTVCTWYTYHAVTVPAKPQTNACGDHMRLFGCRL